MTRTTTVKLGLAVALPALAIISGCAGRKPVAEMARAEQAVQHAETTSEASRYAPVELSSAEQKLASARRAMDDGEYKDARRLAEQALADAQLAESKAESKVARDQATRTRQDIEALQAEAASADTVVIEQKRTIRTIAPAPAVVVQHTAPAPAAVVVERPAPVAVVVERPAPARVTSVVVGRPATVSPVVVEHEPQVVVVPE